MYYTTWWMSVYRGRRGKERYQQRRAIVFCSRPAAEPTVAARNHLLCIVHRDCPCPLQHNADSQLPCPLCNSHHLYRGREDVTRARKTSPVTRTCHIHCWLPNQPLQLESCSRSMSWRGRGAHAKCFTCSNKTTFIINS